MYSYKYHLLEVLEEYFIKYHLHIMATEMEGKKKTKVNKGRKKNIEGKDCQIQEKERKKREDNRVKKTRDPQSTQDRQHIRREKESAQKSEVSISCRFHPNPATMSFRVF